MLKDRLASYPVLGLACACAFALLSIPVTLGWPIPGDVGLLAAALRFRFAPLVVTAQLLSFISSFVPSVMICSAITFAELWRARRLRLGTSWALAALAGHTLCNIAVRVAIGRLPPPGGYIGNLLPELWAGFQVYAYPSGHAGAAVMAYWPLAAVLWSNARLRRPAVVAAALISLGSGLGRIYLGVHWPTDVLGGYLLAGAWLAVGLGIRQRYNA